MSITEEQIHKGCCLCGQVRYEAEGIPRIVAHCHCVDCQRLTGAGHSTGAMFHVSKFRLTGSTAEYKLKSENGNVVTRVFCPSCGSPILGRNTGMDGYVTISLGTLEDSSDFEPAVVVFARNRKPWDAMIDSVPTFDGQPSWNPDATDA